MTPLNPNLDALIDALARSVAQDYLRLQTIPALESFPARSEPVQVPNNEQAA